MLCHRARSQPTVARRAAREGKVVRLSLVTVECRDRVHVQKRLRILEVVEVWLQLHDKLVNSLFDPLLLRLPCHVELSWLVFLIGSIVEYLRAAVNSPLDATDHLHNFGVGQLGVHRHLSHHFTVLVKVGAVLRVACDHL